MVTALGTGCVSHPALGRARAQIPVQLVFCIASHMANTINTGSNCSSQPAKVQNRESNGDTSWGWGGKNNKIKHLPKIDSVIRKRKGGGENAEGFITSVKIAFSDLRHLTQHFLSQYFTVIKGREHQVCGKWWQICV